MWISQYWALSCLFLFGCAPYFVSVKKDLIDVSCLASTYVKSPDPRQGDPPVGEKLFVKWSVPRKEKEKDLRLIVEIIYKDLSHETLSHSILKKRSLLTHSLIGKHYREKGGYLAYKAEIQGQKGEVLREWKHQLWVERIVVD